MKQSFAERLTTEDIQKILSKCGLKLAEQLPNPIMRGEDKEAEEYSIMLKAMPHNVKPYNGMNIIACPIDGKNFIFLPDYYMGNEEVLLIEIRDYIMYEMASLMGNEEEWLKNSRYLNEMYNQYMEDKFGDEYIISYDEYSKEIQKQIENEDQNIQI